jgi:O-antigen ligase
MKEYSEKRMLLKRGGYLIYGLLALSLTLVVGYFASLNPEWLHVSFKITKIQDFIIPFIGVGLIYVLIRRPEWGLLGLIAILITNFSEIGVRFYHIPSLLQIFTPILALIIFYRSLFSKQYKFVWDPLFYWLAVYVGFLFLSSIWAMNPDLSDEVSFEYLKCLLFTFVVVNLAQSKTSLRQISWTLVLSGAFLATISVYQVMTSSYGFEFGGFGHIKQARIYGSVDDPRICGPLSDPNFYAQILIMLFPVALYRLWDETSIRLKALAGYTSAMILLALVFTYSRGGAVALMFVLLAAFIHKKKLRYIFVGLLIIIPMIFLAPDKFINRLTTLEQLFPGEDSVVHIDSSFQERILYMTVAKEMFDDHPVLGVGVGNYAEYYPEYSSEVGSLGSAYEDIDKPRFPHSLYLQVAAETGLVGVVLFLIVVALSLFCFGQAYYLFKVSKDKVSADIVMSFGLGLFGYLTTSIILHGDYIRYLWLLFTLAIVSIHLAKSMRREDDPSYG